MADVTKPDISTEIAKRERCDYQYLLGWLPNPDSVLKKLGKDIGTYRELMADPHVRGCIKSRRAGVLSLCRGFDRGVADRGRAEILEKIFADLDLQDIISQMLDACQFGYAPLEIIWRPVGGLVLPSSIIGKPPEWFVFDGENNLRLKTRTNWIYGEPVPEKKFLLPRQEPSYKNPYGFPDLSSCFWPVTFKRGGMKFWIRFSEKYGMPQIVGKHPRGQSDAEAAKLADDLQEMVQDAVMVIPDDTSVELLEATGKAASAGVYQGLWTACRQEISIVQLGHEGAAQSTPGRLGGEDTALVVRDEIVMADKKIVEQAINTLVGWIWDLNFSGPKPVYSMWREEDVDKNLAERDEILTRSGIRFTKKHFTREYGLSDDEFEVGAPAPVPATGNGHPASFAEGDNAEDTGRAEIDAMVDRVEKEADFADWWVQVQKLLDSATSMEDLRDRLIDLFREMKPDKLGAVMQQAFTEANLSGRYELLKSVGKVK